MIGRHPQIFTGLETQWLFEDWQTDPAGKDRWLSRMAVMYATPFGTLRDTCEPARRPEQALDLMMAELARYAGKSRWGEKTPGNAGVIPRILRFWPDAFVVHITRDPRDIYASMVNNNRWTEVEEFVPRYLSTVVAAREWLASHGGEHDRYYELRYEDLVIHPREEIRRLLEFLGEGFDARASEFPGQPEDFHRVYGATGKKSPTLARLSEPLTRSRIGVWRDVVPTEKWSAIYRELSRRGAARIADELRFEAAA
jgi:hypothetical protein